MVKDIGSTVYTEEPEQPQELSKYKIIYRPKGPADEIWEGPVNRFVQVGYKIHTVRENFVLMELASNGKYSDVINVKDVPTKEVREYIMKGWEVGSLSLSTRFVRMVKK